MARSRPRFTLPERLTARVQRLLRWVEGLKNDLAKERVAHADTQTLWRRQYEDLQKERTLIIDTYRTKVEAHQKEVGEKNALLAHLRSEIGSLQHALSVANNLPTAFHGDAHRMVPLKYWSDKEILMFLHLLETVRMDKNHAHGLDHAGRLSTVDAPFPNLLLLQVTEEVGIRGILVRPHTSIAVAE